MGQPFEESGDLGDRQVVGPLLQQFVEPGLITLDDLVAVALRQMVVGY